MVAALASCDFLFTFAPAPFNGISGSPESSGEDENAWLETEQPGTEPEGYPTDQPEVKEATFAYMSFQNISFEYNEEYVVIPNQDDTILTMSCNDYVFINISFGYYPDDTREDLHEWRFNYESQDVEISNRRDSYIEVAGLEALGSDFHFFDRENNYEGEWTVVTLRRPGGETYTFRLSVGFLYVDDNAFNSNGLKHIDNFSSYRADLQRMLDSVEIL
jgi:hypothetical protein